MKNSISVVLPYYQNSKTIERCLLSISNQIVKPFEIIIINDASSDWNEGKKILNSFSDLPIKIIEHQYNRNGAAARNSGIKKAKGDFIAFMDADDEWMPNHLKALLSLLRKSHSNLVYSSCKVFGKEKVYFLPNKGIEASENLGEYLFCEDGFIATPSIMIRANIAKKFLFNKNLRRHQDYEFLLKLEDSDISMSWSSVTSVIVHWENNDVDKKGGTWEFSFKWFTDYKKFLSTKARSNFILKFVVFRNLEKREIYRALKYYGSYCKPWHINFKNYYRLISFLFFGEVKIPSVWRK